MDTLVVVFGWAKVGTTLTHACHNGASKTLCGRRIRPEWLYDGEWADGPECQVCSSRSESESTSVPCDIGAGTA
jgi:hypothetical protein